MKKNFLALYFSYRCLGIQDLSNTKRLFGKNRKVRLNIVNFQTMWQYCRSDGKGNINFLHIIIMFLWSFAGLLQCFWEESLSPALYDSWGFYRSALPLFKSILNQTFKYFIVCRYGREHFSESVQCHLTDTLHMRQLSESY